MSLVYGSVCSGIEAASIAWEPLGMRPAWFSEIEPFPCAVLAHHWPDVTNLGDMTLIADRVRSGDIDAPDLLVGGTPCQAFSIAGLRCGLDDHRGVLTLKYVELANAIDSQRIESGHQPAIIVWENVPGVLSSIDNAFGCFLAGLAGEDEPLEPGDRPESRKANAFWRWDAKTNSHIPKWPQRGCVIGRQRKVAWRILDAQYVGVAQRRRRVFVVASAREDFNPEEVLFEFEGVRRDIAPRRGEGQGSPGDVGTGVKVGSHWDNPANPHPTLNQSHNTGGIGLSNQEIFAQRGCGLVGAYRMVAFGEYTDDETASTVKARDYKDATDLAVFSSTGAGAWIEGAGTLRAREQESHEHLAVMAIHGTQDPDANYELAHTLGRNHGQENAVIAFTSKDSGHDAITELSPTLRSGSNVNGNQNAGAPPAIAYSNAAVLSGGDTQSFMSEYVAVRRLTPVECERLQGFPDNHTLIPANKRNKLAADELAYLRSHFPDMPEEDAHRMAADGPRYKAIGNSMAVPVMRWIGRRIINALPKNVESPVRSRPFLKWAGGKFSVIDEVLVHLPRGRRLIEPFAGGGSIFLNAGFGEVIASDACDDLILTYQVMQREPLAAIDKAAMMFREGNTQDYFDDIKARFNRREMTQLERAAAFIYLNRHCYNGLMRYNRQGEFNVGYGKYRQPYFPRAELEAFANVASRYTFVVADCTDTVALAGEGDIIFCDPPYEPMPGKSGFTNYSGHRFRFDDQVRLAQSLKAASMRGARIVITNSGAPAINELYSSLGFKVMPLRARRSISCDGESREAATDIIATLM